MLIYISYIVLGTAVCALLDTRDGIFRTWYMSDPTKGVMAALVLHIWPILAICMIIYRIKR